LAYYKVWQVNLNEYVSKANSEIQRAVVEAHLRDPARSNKIPPHTTAEFHPRDLSAGLLPEIPHAPSVPPLIIMRQQSPQIPATQLVHTQLNYQPSAEMNVFMGTGHKRKADQLIFAQEDIREQKRAPKKCWKCEEIGCPGATGKHKCPSPCKSCGTYECAGKNSRLPGKLCPVLLQAQEH
jgi:hypothetical protein